MRYLFLLCFLSSCIASRTFDMPYYAIYEQHQITKKLRRIDFDDIYQKNKITIYRDSVIYNDRTYFIEKSEEDIVTKIETYYFDDSSKMLVWNKPSGVVILYYRQNHTIVRMAKDENDL